MKTTEKQRNSAKEYYKKRKATGLCIYCPNQAEPGHIRCEICKEITADYCAGLRDIRKMKGLCAECGKRPPRDGRVSCQECADRFRLNNKNRKKLSINIAN